MKKFAIAWDSWDELYLYQVVADTPEQAVFQKFKELYPDVEDYSDYVNIPIDTLIIRIWNHSEVNVRVIEIK